MFFGHISSCYIYLICIIPGVILQSDLTNELYCLWVTRIYISWSSDFHFILPLVNKHLNVLHFTFDIQSDKTADFLCPRDESRGH